MYEFSTKYFKCKHRDLGTCEPKWNEAIVQDLLLRPFSEVINSVFKANCIYLLSDGELKDVSHECKGCMKELPVKAAGFQT